MKIVKALINIVNICILCNMTIMLIGEFLAIFEIYWITGVGYMRPLAMMIYIIINFIVLLSFNSMVYICFRLKKATIKLLPYNIICTTITVVSLLPLLYFL